MLYKTAIQTGLRSSELRSLTEGRFFVGVEILKPYVVCKAGSTKNAKDARQYVTAGLAAEIREHLARKAPKAPVFRMPAATDVVDMLRADLAESRRVWLDKAQHDPDEYQRRLRSDFLIDVNHEGEVLDFHSLRHTTGAWLAKGGGIRKRYKP